MRILHVSDISNVGYTLVKELVRMGIDAALVKPINLPLIQRADISSDDFIIKLGVKKRVLPLAKMGRYLLKEKKNWDLFHIHYLYTIAYTTKFFKLPYIVQVHGNDVRTALSGGIYHGVIHKALKRIAGRGALKLLASTPNQVHLVEELIPRIKAEYLPLPIDLELFSEAKARQLSTLFSHLHDGVDILITMPTSLNFKTKGNDIFVKALSKVNFFSKSYRIAAIAYGNDLRKFIELARKLNLWKHVTLLNKIPNDQMPGLYGASDLIIGAITPNEVFGMTALEAMACGTSTLNTWSKRYYGETGFPTIPYDEEAIKQFLQDFLNDDDLLENLARKQKRIVQENHNSEKVAKRLLEIYKQKL